MDKMYYKPKTFIDGMMELQKDLKEYHSFTLSNVDFVSHILTNCRQEYDSCLQSYKLENKEGKDVDIDDFTNDLEETFEIHWRRRKKDYTEIGNKYTFQKHMEKCEMCKFANQKTTKKKFKIKF